MVIRHLANINTNIRDILTELRSLRSDVDALRDRTVNCGPRLDFTTLPPFPLQNIEQIGDLDGRIQIPEEKLLLVRDGIII